ncbi:SBBP repeat-containing protein [Hymenobacter humi]|uniref:SBBP repeat-containing protein n=1 Tax=Hymenobacter humi TaxID=1411620 RepID=A0ABW2U6G4_9BACT
MARYTTEAGPRMFSIATARAVAVDGAGNVYVTGITYVGSQMPPDWLTVKYSPSGAQQWVARYNGPANGPDEAQALAVDATGNVYVTGYSNGLGTSSDYTTVKYSTDGQRLWEARYNGPANGNDRAEDVALDSAGNVYVTGYSTGAVAGYTTLKYAPSGQQLWVARYDRPGQSGSFAEALAVDAAGNVAVTGYSYGDDRSSGADYATVKYSTEGQQLWEAIYNGPGNDFDQAQGVAMDAAGNVFVTGFVLGPELRTADYATLKYSPTGRLLWTALYNGPGNGDDTARDLAVDAAGNVLVTGVSQGSSLQSDYATLKYAPDGQPLWEARYDGPGHGDDMANALALDAAGNAYVTGSSGGNSGTFVDYATVKYSPAGQQLWVARYDGPIKRKTGPVRWPWMCGATSTSRVIPPAPALPAPARTTPPLNTRSRGWPSPPRSATVP